MTSSYGGGVAYGAGNYGVGVYGVNVAQYANLSLELDASMIRTDVFAGSGTYPQTVIENFTGDGTRIAWPLAHLPDTTYVQPVLYVSGVVRPFSGTGAWVIQRISPGVSWLISGSDGPPAPGAPVQVTYQYMAPTVLRMRSASAIADFVALPSVGRFGRMPDTTAASFDQAQADMAGDLQLWNSPVQRIRLLMTQESAAWGQSGLTEDQIIEVVSHRLGVDITGVISVLSESGGQGSTGGARLTNLTIEA